MSRPKVHPPQFIAVTADEYELTLGALTPSKSLQLGAATRSSPYTKALSMGGCFGEARPKAARCCGIPMDTIPPGS